ncbi:MFS transporter [Saccharopolyspora shandongensis]|uniref:MFS transporter n=1 Tax=Saccharopolyspora shandongensis TaxID=418495 RepID=UPI00344700D0
MTRDMCQLIVGALEIDFICWPRSARPSQTSSTMETEWEVPMGTATTATRDRAMPWKAAVASAIGSILEYYDFFVYGPMAALVFAELFFPAASSEAGLLLSLGTFAVGFVARPLGGIVIGHFGDRVGRRAMLVVTFLLTGVVTFAIGLLPTYAQIGIWAPILLVSLRFLQGVGLGGEWGGAALLTVEHAPAGRRGFFGSLVQAGAPIGVILSNGVVAVLAGTLSREQLLAWGWRIPFLISIVLVLVGLVLRWRITESPEFVRTRQSSERVRLPVLDALRHYPKQIAGAVGVHLGDTTLGFVQGIFLLGFATKVLGMDATAVLLANIAGSAVNLAVTPVIGHLADRFGRRSVLAAGAVALAVWAFPMFWLINTRSVVALFAAFAVGSVIVATIFAPQTSFFAELFEPRVRYSGISIGFQVATVLGGGLSPIIAQGLQTGVRGTWPVSLMLVVVAVISLVSVMALRPPAESGRSRTAAAGRASGDEVDA